MHVVILRDSGKIASGDTNEASLIGGVQSVDDVWRSRWFFSNRPPQRASSSVTWRECHPQADRFRGVPHLGVRFGDRGGVHSGGGQHSLLRRGSHSLVQLAPPVHAPFPFRAM
ncbi:hypothetical protein CMUS01_05789 [Colletotrichum musicola]|uniref:Uncharacterized protein n=1 Tax=Colletotrichum musicola TaxID=2175873 RepID=A0A8H6NJZ6_9PEZI|nr:hypothetical protein CMUS01_05789 [Colletotrichum musicola]